MKPLALALGLFAVAAPAFSQTAGPAPAPAAAPATYGAPIGLDAARALIDKTLEAARAAGFRMAVAIVEPSGELVAFARMDDTQ